MSKIRIQTEERGILSYGDDVIHYDIIRRISSDCKLQKVIIKVHPNQRVVVTVADHVSKQAIQLAMVKRVRWIWKNIKAFESLTEYVLPRKYVSGETQFYLGRRYMLKVLRNEKALTVKLARGQLNVSLIFEKTNNPKKIKSMLDNWYQHRARIVYQERLHALLHKTSWVKGIPSFRLMEMKKQWGSCSSKGNLLLNPHLIKAPKECIDYVILHELCHITEYNHSEKFWRLLDQVMPNWKEVKSKLDDMAEQYLNV
jgi:predicted metal-dependent hydrolase